MIRFRSLVLGVLLAPALLPVAQVEDHTFDSDGVPIRFTLQGEGETPLVLLHGYAASLETMAALTPALKDDYWVISVDARGHGKSGKPHDPQRYGLEMVEDVVRLLDHLGVERAHVFGYSMGGLITLKLATTHPDRLLSAVAGGYGWPESSPEGDAFMDRVAEALEKGEGFGPLFASLTAEGEEPPPPEQIEGIERMLLAVNDPLALAAAARGFRHLALDAAALAANTVPTMAIVGERDPLAEDVERLGKAMAHVEVVVIEGADHMSAGMSPKFIASLKRFLADPTTAELQASGASGATER